MHLYESHDYRGYKINIYYDEEPLHPRRDWDNIGTFYTAHKHYCPEKQFDANFDINEVFDGKIGNFKTSFLQEYIALPIYMYDHSGQTVSTCPFSDPWDSGFFGIVAVPVEKVKKEYGWKKLTADRRKQIETYLEGEVETYDMFLRGEVFGFMIEVDEDADGYEDLPDVDDSCWGFFGNDSIKEILSEAEASIDDVLKAKDERDAKEAKCEAIYEAFCVD